MAVPRGLRQSNSFNGLHASGTPKYSTRSLGILPTVSHPDAEGRADERLTSKLVVIVTPAPSGRGRVQARLEDDDHVLCVSSTPYFDAARKLVTKGYDPKTTLILRHAGSETESLECRLATAAGLTVEETKYGPKLRRWKPLSTLAVAPRTAPSVLATTTLAAPAVKDARRKVQAPSRSQNLNNP
jgi:hypothetical protein